MARRGDGLVLRGKTYWLDFTHMGQRHQVRLGRNISKSVAREFAQDERVDSEWGKGHWRKEAPGFVFRDGR